MDLNKIIGLSSKVIMGVLILVGLGMSYTVLKDGNPKGWNEQAMYDQGQIAITNNPSEMEGLSAEALEKKIKAEGLKTQQTTLARQTENVESTLGFTKWVLIIALVLIAFALILSVVLAPKKFAIAGIGIVVFGLILYGVYAGATAEVPAKLTMMEADKMAQAANPEEFEAVYTGENWKMAGAAVISSLVLAGIAIVGIVVSSVVKLVK